MDDSQKLIFKLFDGKYLIDEVVYAVKQETVEN